MYRFNIWTILIMVLLVMTAGPVVAQEERAEAVDDAAHADDAAETDAPDEQGASDGAAVDTTAAGAPPPVSAENQADRGTYTIRLRDLEDRVNRLKEQIFRSKARLSLLAETVLEKKIAGAKATIVFRNQMGGSFRLDKATFLLDGGPIFNKSDVDGSLSKRKEITLFDGPLTPGDHTLSVVLQYKGHGYGIFSYLKGYAFKTRSSYTFSIMEGKAIQLETVGYEKGGPTTPLEERPAVRYIEEFGDYHGESSGETDATDDDA